MSEGTIADDEVLYRRIPPGKDWFEPPDRISSLNFKLRPGELGISVYRKITVNAADVLSKPGAIVGSGVVQAIVGQIRDARDGNGNLLNLDVVPVNDENDHGHAEIRGPERGVISKSTAKALKKLFTLAESASEKR